MQGGRVPPHNLEAERSVIGAILLNNEAIHRVYEVQLDADDFYKEAHRKIFDVLKSLSERGEPLDLITLSSVLKDRGWYDEIGGAQTITSFFEESYSVSNIGNYAQIVREKAVLRRMIAVCDEIQGEAYSGVENVDQFLDDAETKVLAASDAANNQSFSSMHEILLSTMTNIEEVAQRKSDIVGLPSGFTELDKMTAGFRAGQMIVLAARPGMGKTSWFASMIQTITQGGKHVAAVFSLEMSKDELGFRFLSGMSRIDSKRLKIGRLTDRDWPRLAQAADQLSKSKIFIDDTGGVSVMDVRSKCRRLKTMEKRLDLVVVDYLQLMRGPRANKGGSDNRVQEISEISRGLKTLAKELGCPVVALSQLNRGVDSRPNKRPVLSDLRDSGAIEQDADIVMFIYRDEVYNPDTEDKGVAELIIAKHRAGEQGTVRMAWLKEFTLFANLAPEGGMPGPGNPIPIRRNDRGGGGPDLSL